MNYWDRETNRPHDPRCRICKVTLYLEDDCEWPESKMQMLCGGCAVGEVGRLLKLVARWREKARAVMEGV